MDVLETVVTVDQTTDTPPCYGQEVPHNEGLVCGRCAIAEQCYVAYCERLAAGQPVRIISPAPVVNGTNGKH